MGNIFMRFPKGKKKAITLSYDDGVEQDIQLVDVMKQYGLKGTFNIGTGLMSEEGTVFEPGTIHRKMSRQQIINTFENSGMEVAVHGYTHPFLEQLPMNLCIEEIVKNREELEEMFHTIVRGMAYPFGTFNDDVVAVLKQSGIVYSRTVIASHGFKLPKDWLRLEATCHHADEQLPVLMDKFLADEVKREPILFYLWGHSFEFERDNNWNIIEDFGKKMGDREEIWYATNIEIYDYIKAYEQLQFSMEGTRVYNPTAINLYFETRDDMICIKSGEMLELPKSILYTRGLH